MNLGPSVFLLPSLVVYLIIGTIIFIGFEGGFYLGRIRYQRSSKEKDSLVGPMVASTLGLLAFMLSFSFGVASSHFDARRQLVLDEANAIRSTYNLTNLLSESGRNESKRLLREYIHIRTSTVIPKTGVFKLKTKEQAIKLLERTNEIQDRLLAIAIDTEIKGSGASSSWLYLQTLNDMFNLQTKRIAIATHNRIPATIWIVLFGLAIFGMAAMGYHAGLVGIRGFFVYQVLILAFSLVIVLIFDLDRPKQGFFHVSQQAMVDLEQRINQVTEK